MIIWKKIQLEGLQLIHNEQLSNWVNYSDTVELPFDVIHEDRHTKVQFQNENRLKIAAIRFSLEGNFRRSVSAVDHEGRPLNIQGESELYQILFEQVQVENKELRFPQPVAAEEIVITVFNEDSAPLNITGIEVVYYMDRLIFEGSVQEPLQLLYGNPEARSPVYDLANFKTYILREPLQEASVSRGTEQPDFTKERGSEAWGPLSFQRLFQIAIILASIVLVVLIGTKLSRQNKNNDA
ncbi:MAG: hypothetical protein LRY73_17680 [Bacillus sp. (in: Bacteria)]|nr:hypothetical protein [Bacillus sp. (in: firmicutes)]